MLRPDINTQRPATIEQLVLAVGASRAEQGSSTVFDKFMYDYVGHVRHDEYPTEIWQDGIYGRRRFDRRDSQQIGHYSLYGSLLQVRYSSDHDEERVEANTGVVYANMLRGVFPVLLDVVAIRSENDYRIQSMDIEFGSNELGVLALACTSSRLWLVTEEGEETLHDVRELALRPDIQIEPRSTEPESVTIAA